MAGKIILPVTGGVDTMRKEGRCRCFPAGESRGLHGMHAVNTKPLDVDDQQFQKEIAASSEPVLVDFWASWCGPCKMVAPVLEELAADYEGKVKILKVNVDENPDTASRYSIMSIPTMILFKDGEPIQTLIGFRNKEELKGIIDPSL
jgi:thioredoxin 1